MTNWPPGAERAFVERERAQQVAETEAWNAWEQMAKASDGLDKLTDIMIKAAHEAADAVDGGPNPDVIVEVVRRWLDGQVDLYDWFVAHGLIESFEDWREAQAEREGGEEPNRDGEEQDRRGDEERDARVADGRMR